MTAGGLNRIAQQPAYGIRESFTLDVDPMSASPGILGWTPAALQSRERWYPTATTLDTGDLLVSGSFGPPLYSLSEWSRETYDATTDSWLGPKENEYLDATHTCTFLDDPLAFHDYPKMHVLSTRELMWVDGDDDSVAPPLTRSWFLSLAGPADCSGPSPYRLRDGVTDPLIEARNRGGNSVHLVTLEYDPVFQDFDVTDVVYTIAGTEHGFDDMDCPCEQDPEATNAVLRMVAPSASTSWEQDDASGMGTGPKNLIAPRVNCNTVLLLDGSLLVVGGADKQDEQEPEGCGCDYRKKPERYRPPEVFKNISLTKWTEMAAQVSARLYHSVAGLLPDGRVFSAGGTAGIQGQGEFQSVELYSPPYMFRGPRPVIENEFSGPVQYGQPGSITVGLRGAGANAQVSRLALVRNGAMTHAFDMNQRYVELRALPTSPGAGQTSVTIDFTWPDDGFEAPPGWYMLTAIADMDSGAVPSSNNIPSRAIWVNLQ